jgi:DNA polymerase
MSEQTAAFLKEMGLGPRWVLREGAGAPVEASPAVTSPESTASLAAAMPVSDMTWRQLQDHVAVCRACGLCEGRSNTVFGSGDPQASWLFIGAAPNQADEAQGLPLAGAGGRLFQNMLHAIDLAPDQDVYLTNLLKCRPHDGENDGQIQAEELAACRPHLQRQIALLQPAMIVALGAEVGRALLGLEAGTTALRGHMHQFAGVPLLVTHAPQELLTTPTAKANVWRDLCLARASMANDARDAAAE